MIQMTANGILQIPFLYCGHPRAGQADGRFHGESLRRASAPGCTASCAPSKPPIYASAASMRAPSSTGPRYAGSAPAFSAVSLLFTYLHPAPAAVAPLEPAGPGQRAAPDLACNTAVSFTTNTNWQSYVPETTMSYLTPDDRSGHAQLLLGGGRDRHRHRGDPRIRAPLHQDARQLLGGFDALHPVHPAAAFHRGARCCSARKA